MDEAANTEASEEESDAISSDEATDSSSRRYINIHVTGQNSDVDINIDKGQLGHFLQKISHSKLLSFTKYLPMILRIHTFIVWYHWDVMTSILYFEQNGKTKCNFCIRKENNRKMIEKQRKQEKNRDKY